MITIQTSSNPSFAYVELIELPRKNAYLLVGWDFNNIAQRQTTSSSIAKLQKRIAKVARKLTIDAPYMFKTFPLAYIANEIKEITKEQTRTLLQEADKTDLDIARLQLNEELALLDQLEDTNYTLLTFSLDEDNDTFVIRDSFQNGQQMVEYTQTPHGLVQQIDVKCASHTNNGNLLLSIKYQKEK